MNSLYQYECDQMLHLWHYEWNDMIKMTSCVRADDRFMTLRVRQCDQFMLAILYSGILSYFVFFLQIVYLATNISIVAKITPFYVPLSWYKILPFSSNVILSLKNNSKSWIHWITGYIKNTYVNCHTDIS